MLFGRTVLIVEAQYLIALDLQHTLEDLVPGNVIIAQDAQHARQKALSMCEIAIVEIETNLADNIALVGELLRQGVPVVALTADSDLQQNLNWFADTPILLKPAPADRVLAAIGELRMPQKE